MIKAIFTDIGGVLLTNGWDHVGRLEAVQHFKLDQDEFHQRHEMVFGGYEEGRMSIQDYLRFSVFHCQRDFSPAEFITYMKERSQKQGNLIEILTQIKRAHGLPVFAVSNEGRELGEYRIETFHLKDFIDAFIVSGFVGMRKPALSIYKLALDLAQVQPDEALYIDDREVLIEAGERAGLVTLWHRDEEKTKQELARHELIP